MKIRAGFVSNSSSSSFVIPNRNGEHTVDRIFDTLQEMYIEKYQKTEKKKELARLKKEFREMLYVFAIDTKTDKTSLAKWINSITFWGFTPSKLKNNSIWIISNGDNTIPYEFCNLIEEKFGVHCRHLG